MIIIIGFSILFIIGLIFTLSIPFACISEAKDNKEKDLLISQGKPKICVHCRKEVDPEATICPYCRHYPYS